MLLKQCKNNKIDSFSTIFWPFCENKDFYIPNQNKYTFNGIELIVKHPLLCRIKLMHKNNISYKIQILITLIPYKDN